MVDHIVLTGDGFEVGTANAALVVTFVAWITEDGQIFQTEDSEHFFIKE